MTPEGKIQYYAMAKLKAKGCLVRKISYEGRRGCPDLLVLVPYRVGVPGKSVPWLVWPKEAQTMFLEIKKDEQTKPDPHQQREHERMRAVGADVRTIGSKAKVDSLVAELFPGE